MSSAAVRTNDWVWFQSGPQTWEAGLLLNNGGDGGYYRVRDHENTEHNVSASQVKQMPAGMSSGIPDMINLPELTEGGLMHNLCLRYSRNEIYTYTGNILVAFNPYRLLDLYGMETFAKYKNKALGEMPPHIFAIAQETFHNMSRTRKDQCVVISGESGAGKTESTKLLLQYLSLISTTKSAVQDQIVDASPILEAFGNAKTVRNDNSSRFGKFVELQFSPDGSIRGAKMVDYLLEKSRIVSQAAEERNYHIFYSLLAGLGAEEKQALGLGAGGRYAYLSNGLVSLPGIDDAADFSAVVESMRTLSFGESVTHIWRALAAVLHLGNLSFSESESSGMRCADVSSAAVLEHVARLLGVEPQKLALALTKRLTTVRAETTVTPLSRVQALDSRDALAKAVYGRMFRWIVKFINERTCRREALPFVGILDIFGFEDFLFNSFEQFCINYANERLQYYFNEHIFKMEQQEYTKEGISWSTIEFQDNQPCIELISKRPLGLIFLLDEESNLPKTTDETLLAKFAEHHGKSPCFLRPKTSQAVFGVRHYAGDVLYQASGFLDKNRDSLRTDLQEALLQSGSAFVVTLFSPETFEEPAAESPLASPGASPVSALPPADAFGTLTRTSSMGSKYAPARRGAGGSKVRTTGYQFNTSLTELVATLTACNPYFVRCIKPNSRKQPLTVEKALVLAQLRYSGMLETIRVRRAGFATRVPIAEFNERYRLIRPVPPSTGAREAAAAILQEARLEARQFGIGATKVFLRVEGDARLEAARAVKIGRYAVSLQALARMVLQRAKFKRARKDLVAAQRRIRGFVVRQRAVVLKRGVVRMQAVYRGWRTRREFRRKVEDRVRERAAKVEAQKRAELAAPQSDTDRRAAQAAIARQPIQCAVPQAVAELLSHGEPRVVEPLRDAAALRMHDEITDTAEVAERLGLVSAAAAAGDGRAAFRRYAQTFFRDESTVEFSPAQLEASLCKLPPFLAPKAVDVYNALLYLAASPKLPVGHRYLTAKWVCDLALRFPQLADETYAQLLKLLTNNPHPDFVGRVWDTLYLVLGVVQPSTILAKVVLAFVWSETGSAELSAALGTRLLRTMKNGKRRKGLTSVEVRALELKCPLVVAVRLPDAQALHVVVDAAATVAEVVDCVAASVGMVARAGWTLVLGQHKGKQKVWSNDHTHVLDMVFEHEIDGTVLEESLRALKLAADARAAVMRRQSIAAGAPPLKAPKPKLPGAASAGAAGGSDLAVHFDLARTYLLPLQALDDDAVDLDLTRRQLLADIARREPSLPLDSAGYIQNQLAANNLADAVSAAALTPLYFANVFAVSEPSAFPHDDVQLLLSQTGLFVVDARSERRTIFVSATYDEVEFNAAAKDDSFFRCTVQGREYTFETDAGELARFLAVFIEELKETSNLAVALAEHNPGDGSGFAFQVGTVLEIVQRDAEKGLVLGKLQPQGTTGWFKRELIDPLLGLPQLTPEGLAVLKPAQREMAANLARGLVFDLKSGGGGAGGSKGDGLDEFAALQRDPRLEDPAYDLINWLGANVETSHDAHDKKAKKAAAVTDNQRVLFLETNVRWSATPAAWPVLRSVPEPLVQMAQEAYSVLMQYMGDLPTKKDSASLANSLIGAALKMVPIRDEVYAQVLKQINANPNQKPDSSRKGWIILTLLCSFVPPSEELEPYLRRHLSGIAKDKAHAATAAAQDCERRLHASKAFPRALPPNAFEIQALERGSAVEFQVSVADSSLQSIFLGHTTIAADIHGELCDANSVTERDEFGLFMELSDGQMLLPLLPRDLVLDVITLAIIMAAQASTASKKPLTARLTFKRKLWISTQNDAMLFPLLLGQMVELLKRGELYTADKLDKAARATTARSIALGWVFEKLDPSQKELIKAFMPEVLKIGGSLADWEKAAKAEHKQVSHLDQVSAGRSLMSELKTWELWGSFVFEVKAPTHKIQKQLLALTPTKIVLLARDSRKVVGSFLYREVVTMRLEANGFVLVVGDLMSKKRERFETSFSYVISHILIAYIAVLLGAGHLESMKNAHDLQD